MFWGKIETVSHSFKVWNWSFIQVFYPVFKICSQSTFWLLVCRSINQPMSLDSLCLDEQPCVYHLEGSFSFRSPSRPLASGIKKKKKTCCSFITCWLSLDHKTFMHSGVSLVVCQYWRVKEIDASNIICLFAHLYMCISVCGYAVNLCLLILLVDYYNIPQVQPPHLIASSICAPCFTHPGICFFSFPSLM